VNAPERPDPAPVVSGLPRLSPARAPAGPPTSPGAAPARPPSSPAAARGAAAVRVLADAPSADSVEEEVAAAVLAVPGVVRLHGGPFGGLGTYLPGRRVTGVRIDDAGTEVHVVLTTAEPIAVTAARVQRAVSALAPMPVRVHVDDIDVPEISTEE